MNTRRLHEWLPAAAVIMMIPTSSCAQSETGVRWEERVEVSAGDAHRGPWRMNESEFHFVDDPTVAISAGGQVGVAWADQKQKDIFFQVHEPEGGTRFEQAVNISRSSEIFSWLPRVVMAGDDAGEIHVLWQEIVFSGGSHGGEIFFARSADGGRSFTEPRNLSNTKAGAGKGRLTAERWENGSLDLIMDGQGNLYAAWTEYEGTLWFSKSTDRGASFSAPAEIAGQEGGPPARAPALAAGPRGEVYLAWTVGEDAAADIRFAWSGDGGESFGEPQVVSVSGGHSDVPKLAVDGKGTLHLVYSEGTEGPWQPSGVSYTRWRDGRWEKPRTISQPLPGGVEGAGYPHLAVDGADRVCVLWELFPQLGQRPAGLGFSLSADGGGTFARPQRVPGTGDPREGFNGGHQGLLMRKLAVNDAGGIAVVNATFESDVASRIHLVRGRLDGE